MRKIRFLLLVSTFTLIFSSAVTIAVPAAFMPENCQCSASDGSCSVNMSCEGGCQAICNPEGDCMSYCSGRKDYLLMTANIQMRNGTYSQLIDELSRISGQNISYNPNKPNILINIDSKRGDLWDLLSHLSDRGALQIAGQDFSKIKKTRKNLLSGEKVTFCVRGTPAEVLVRDLSNLTGLRLRVEGGNTMAMVTAQLRDVSLSEILAVVSEQTGSTIMNEDGTFLGQ